MKKTLQAVDHSTHRDRIALNEAIAVFRGQLLVQLRTSGADRNEVCKSGASSTGEVVRRLGRISDHVGLDTRAQNSDCRFDVVFRQLVERALARDGLNQFLAIETHVNTVLCSDGEGLRLFVLVLHVHDARTLAALVLVRRLHTQRGAVLTGARLERERFVKLTINRADERKFLMRDAQSFLCHHVGDF